MARRLTTEDFIIKAKLKHRDIYDYSESKYIKAIIPVKIICKKHGVFEQTPYEHTRGKGCPKCAIENRVLKIRVPNDEFIKKAINIHGDKYDYSLVVYKNAATKVSIICKEHGLFNKSPHNHLRGQGCKWCSVSYYDKKTTDKNKKKFLEKAIKKHFNKYDYSIVDYKRSDIKVKIICPKHGVFEQTPNGHLSDGGCFKCGVDIVREIKKTVHTGWSVTNWEDSSKKSKSFDSFKVYIIKCWNDDEIFYKIGRTFLSVKNRFKGLRNMPYNYEIVKEFIFDTAQGAFDYENKLKREHKIYKHLPVIDFNGKQECFKQINKLWN